MPNRRQLKESNRHLRLLNQELTKQFVYYKNRLKRLELRQEGFETHLGFKAIRDLGTVLWVRIQRSGRPRTSDRVQVSRILPDTCSTSTSDKSANVIVEALLEEFVRLYWRKRGTLVHVYENSYEDLPGQRGFDRRDSLNYFWEFKDDRAAWGTPNVYIERTVDESKSDLFMRVIEGRVWVTTKEAMLPLLASHPEITRGGDGKRAMGTLIRNEEFCAVSELVEPQGFFFLFRNDAFDTRNTNQASDQRLPGHQGRLSFSNLARSWSRQGNTRPRRR